MAESAGSVTIDLDANSIKLLRKLKETQAATHRTANKMQRSMTKSFSLIQKAAIAAFGVQMVRSITNSAIAMERIERGLKAASGSAVDAAADLQFIRKESDRLGLNLQSAASAFTKLSAAAKGTALQGKGAKDIFVAISESSRVMGLSVEQTNGALTAIEQIISKGTVSSEELRGQLGERLPGAFQIAARSMGVTTQELGKMLQQGQVLAEDMLPKFAAELRNTFGGEVEAAANDTQAAFNRFSNAVFELQASFAESGLLQTLTTFAEKAREIAIGLGFIFLNASPEAFGKELADAKDEVDGLNKQIQYMIDEMGMSPTSPAILQLENDLIKAQSKVEEFRYKSIEAMTAVDKAMGNLGGGSTNSKIEDSLKKWLAGFDTAEDKMEAGLATLKEAIALGLVPDEEDQKRIRDAIMEPIFGVVEVTGKRRMLKASKKIFDPMEQYAKQAASNIQDAFADFLFDPFEEGVKGMLKGFLDAIRRMAANQLASSLLGSLGIDKLFGGFRADGGPVAPNKAYIVGERGPELFVPGASGNIIPNGGGATVQNVYNFQAGADVATIQAQIIPMLERQKEVTKGEILSLQRQGRFA